MNDLANLGALAMISGGGNPANSPMFNIKHKKKHMDLMSILGLLDNFAGGLTKGLQSGKQGQQDEQTGQNLKAMSQGGWAPQMGGGGGMGGGTGTGAGAARGGPTGAPGGGAAPTIAQQFPITEMPRGGGPLFPGAEAPGMPGFHGGTPRGGAAGLPGIDLMKPFMQMPPQGQPQGYGGGQGGPFDWTPPTQNRTLNQAGFAGGQSMMGGYTDPFGALSRGNVSFRPGAVDQFPTSRNIEDRRRQGPQGAAPQSPFGGGSPTTPGSRGYQGEVSPEQAQQLLQQQGGSPREVSRLTRLMTPESGGDPRAMNTQGEHSVGLWQINQNAHHGRFGSDQQLMDPATNARAALTLLREQGVGAWLNSWKKIGGDSGGGATGGGQGFGSSPGITDARIENASCPGCAQEGVYSQAAHRLLQVNPNISGKQFLATMKQAIPFLKLDVDSMNKEHKAEMDELKSQHQAEMAQMRNEAADRRETETERWHRSEGERKAQNDQFNHDFKMLQFHQKVDTAKNKLEEARATLDFHKAQLDFQKLREQHLQGARTERLDQGWARIEKEYQAAQTKQIDAKIKAAQKEIEEVGKLEGLAPEDQAQVKELQGMIQQLLQERQQAVESERPPVNPRQRLLQRNQTYGGTEGQSGGGGNLQPGAVIDGYKFRGGDPKDKSNWEQQ